MKRWDYIIFVLIAVLSFGCYAYIQSTYEQGSMVVVEINGEVVKKVSLNEDSTFALDFDGGEYNFIEIKDGHVRITQSTCRDQICVNTPAISQVGQSIVCLPHKLVIRIEGNDQKIDGISG